MQLQQQAGSGRRLSRSASPSLNNNSIHRPALSSLSMEKIVEIVVRLYRWVGPAMWPVSWQALGGLGCLFFLAVGTALYCCL